MPKSFAASLYISFVEKVFFVAITFSLWDTRGGVEQKEERKRGNFLSALIINYQPTLLWHCDIMFHGCYKDDDHYNEINRVKMHCFHS